MKGIKLYHYWRSSSSWRVRWGFAIKGISCEMAEVSLIDGESESAEHRARNPLGYVPVVEFPPREGHPVYLTESLAILEWAEEILPEPALLPGNAETRARIRALAEVINSGTQPIQNPNVLDLITMDPEKRKAWNQRWIRNGLSAYEILARPLAGRFSVGDEITLADLCLIPQCYNALRFEVDLGEFPLLRVIYDTALKTESCQASHPDRYKPLSRS